MAPPRRRVAGYRCGMARRPRSSPRKTPRQGRSRATVHAIVEATAQVLRAHGYQAATLRRIAARAGVGVGSIYQYFASKQGLLAAVTARHLAELGQCVADTVADTASHDAPSRVRALVTGVVRAHQHDPDLHRVLVEQVPRTGALDARDAALRAIEAQVAEVLRGHPEDVRAGPIDVMAAVVVSAVDAAIHTVVLQRPELDPMDVEREVTELALRYLSP